MNDDIVSFWKSDSNLPDCFQVLLSFGAVVERASIDEAYLDLTQLIDDRVKNMITSGIDPRDLSNTFVVGYEDKTREEGLTEWLRSISAGGQSDDLR